jgi:hypothetical protein
LLLAYMPRRALSAQRTIGLAIALRTMTELRSVAPTLPAAIHRQSFGLVERNEDPR